MLSFDIKTLILGNEELKRFCRHNCINIDRLKECRIERIHGILMFGLAKEGIWNTPINMENDIATQPDIVLAIKVEPDGRICIETTEHTNRIRNYLEEREKTNRLYDFLVDALKSGYSLDDAWHLLLTSSDGLEILDNNTYESGSALFIKADKSNGSRYNKSEPIELDVFYFKLLAEFIEFVHRDYNLPYNQIFTKIKIGEFFAEHGKALGWYDHKMVKAYIL